MPEEEGAVILISFEAELGFVLVSSLRAVLSVRDGDFFAINKDSLHIPKSRNEFT
jgi:hypothetical protein